MARRMLKKTIDSLFVENGLLIEEHVRLTLKVGTSKQPKDFTLQTQALEVKLSRHVAELTEREIHSIAKVMEQKLVNLRLLMCAKDIKRLNVK